MANEQAGHQDRELEVLGLRPLARSHGKKFLRHYFQQSLLYIFDLNPRIINSS